MYVYAPHALPLNTYTQRAHVPRYTHTFSHCHRCVFLFTVNLIMFIIYRGECIIYKQKAKKIEEIRICLPFCFDLFKKNKKVDTEPELRFRV